VIREIISFELKSCDITESKRERERERERCGMCRRCGTRGKIQGGTAPVD